MFFHIERYESPRQLTLIGELDVATATELQSVLETLTPEGDLVLDLADLEFLDACGLRVIARSARRMTGKVLLRSPSGIVRRLLDTAGVGRSEKLLVIPDGSPAG
jgi:anti-anti-sigma factor